MATGRAPRRASQADTYAVPQPELDRVEVRDSVEQSQLRLGHVPDAPGGLCCRPSALAGGDVPGSELVPVGPVAHGVLRQVVLVAHRGSVSPPTPARTSSGSWPRGHHSDDARRPPPTASVRRPHNPGPPAAVLRHMSTKRPLIAAALTLGLVPGLLSVVVPSVSGGAQAAAPKYSATITRTEHGIPHISAKDFGSLGFGSGYAAAGTSICTLADTVLTARGQRSRYLGPTGKYDDQVSMTGTNLQADTLVTDLHNRKVVEKLLASQAGPGTQARQMVDGYAAGVNAWLKKIGGAAKITDPSCRGCGVHQARRDRPGHLVRRLPRQPDRLHRPLPPADHRGDAAERERPRHPRAPRERELPEGAVAAARQEQADGRARQGPEVAVRLQRDRHRRRRHDDRPRHGARQPALPVARALPVHPAAADDPRPVRRRRRQPDRLTGREHRLEQGRRLEPHRLDGLPVHAVRVPDAREPHLLPDHRRRQAARQAGRQRHREERRRLAVDGDQEPLPDRPGLRARRPGHVDELDARPASSRSATPTASSCARSTPSSTWARPPAYGTCWRARTRPAACRG